MANLLKTLLNRAAGRPRKDAGRITEGGNFRPGTTITITAPRRFGVALDDYMAAIRAAENVDFTQRQKLYDIYTDALIDGHLRGIVEKRKAGVLSCDIKFRKDGVADEHVNEMIESPWFMNFVEDALDSLFWGFTLVQFYINDQGWIDYYCVPRKHVDPVRRLIKHRQEDITGTSFDEYSGLLLIRAKEANGLFACTTPYTIWKRGNMGDWAQFNQIFGMPVRKYTYDSADPAARDATISDAMEQGSGSVYLCPQDCNLEFIESSNKTGSAETYKSLDDKCNAEMSKVILGNTLTTEASETGTQALGTVHSSVEKNLAKRDRKFILNLLNYEMTDIFAQLGVDTRGGKFVFADAVDDDHTAKRADILIKAKAQLGLPISDDYIYEELNIDRPDNYDELKRDMQEQAAAQAAAQMLAFGRQQQPQRKPDEQQTDGQEEPDRRKPDERTGEGPTNRAHGFFVHAPHAGALEW
jgi:phage gp29-like protein